MKLCWAGHRHIGGRGGEKKVTFSLERGEGEKCATSRSFGLGLWQAQVSGVQAGPRELLWLLGCRLVKRYHEHKTGSAYHVCCALLYSPEILATTIIGCQLCVSAT